MGRKVLYVTEHLHRASGVACWCGEICDRLIDNGWNVRLALKVVSDSAEQYPLRHGEIVVPLIDILRRFDEEDWGLIHINGIWLFSYHRIASAANRKGIPVVWSPHGSLAAWALKYRWWKKLPVWFLYQKKDLVRSCAIHVTAESEVMDLRRLGLGKHIILAPLGVDIKEGGRRFVAYNKNDMSKEDRIILFVGRVAPIKGLENLIKAYARCRQRSKWRLCIIGPDFRGHSNALKLLANEMGVLKQVDFLGPKYGYELERAFYGADLFVLPSYSENFGDVVVDALAHGVPVITTKGTPWKELQEKECGWWIEIGVDSLVAALENAMALSDEDRTAMGERGRRLVADKYTWEASVKKIMQAYSEILGNC